MPFLTSLGDIKKSKLNFKERLFCMISYTPRAAVQAAIGAIYRFQWDFSYGKIFLTATVPLGAFATDMTYKKLLTKDMEAAPASSCG